MAGNSTFDLTTPIRPGLDVFNGAVKANAAEPPDPTTQPNADEYNALCKLMVAIGKVCPLAVISCTGSATPSIQSFVAPGSNVVVGNFTVAHVATGHFTITIAANTLPPTTVNPVAMLNSTVVGQIAAYWSSGVLHILTANTAGTATDLDFTVMIF